MARAWFAYRKIGRGAHLEATESKYRLKEPTAGGLHSGPLWRATGVKMPDEEIILEARE